MTRMRVNADRGAPVKIGSEPPIGATSGSSAVHRDPDALILDPDEALDVLPKVAPMLYPGPRMDDSEKER